MERPRTRVEQHAEAIPAPFRPTRWFWIGVALESTGLLLAVWGRLGLTAFIDAEKAAGRDHGLDELFRLSAGWLAAFWIGVVMAVAGGAILVVSVLRSRRHRAASAQG